jgi:hypothetical protein
MALIRENPRAQRRLAASWPGHEHARDSQWEKWALNVITEAFPGQVDGVDLICITSQHRRWEVLELSNTERLIVADLNYSVMLEIIDSILTESILTQNDFSAPAMVNMAAAIFAWALLEAGEYERASVLAAWAFHPSGWSGLKTIQYLNRAEITYFLLLHEAAHAIVDGGGGPDSAWARKSVDNQLNRMIELDEEMLKGLTNQAATLVIKRPDEDRIATPEDIDFYLPYFRNRSKLLKSEELRREAECDCLSVMGLLRLKYKRNILLVNGPQLTRAEFLTLHGTLSVIARGIILMAGISGLCSQALTMREMRESPQSGRYDYQIEQRIRVEAVNSLALFIIKNVSLEHSAHDLRDDVYHSYKRLLDDYEKSHIRILMDQTTLWLQTISDENTYSDYRAEVWSAISEFAAAEEIIQNDEVGLAQTLVGEALTTLALIRHNKFPDSAFEDGDDQVIGG